MKTRLQNPKPETMVEQASSLPVREASLPRGPDGPSQMLLSRRSAFNVRCSMFGVFLILFSTLDPELSTVHASTFTVINTNDAGAGSLRDALTQANATSGADIIAFNLTGPTRTINVSNALPDITESLTIDGSTQPGFAGAPIIELNGTSAGSGTDGLRIFTSNSTIRGLVINRFNGDGIEISTNGNNVIEGCYLGLNVTGATDFGNNLTGVFITNSPNNVIGGIFATQRNVISGNNSAGIHIGGIFATNNQVLGNIVGLNVTNNPVANSGGGLRINAAFNLIGGPASGARNVISGNSGNGVELAGPINRNNQVLGNYIGADLTGTLDRGNTGDGVFINNSGAHLIGGSFPGEGNLISGNNNDGIEINGVSATNNILHGNLIGTDLTGNNGVANNANGVFITSNSRSNTVGGDFGGAANTIAFNAQDGISVAAANSNTNNAFRGNAIFANGNLGIDLGNSGVQPNDAGDPDTGANQLQNFPVLTNAVANVANTQIQGTLNSRSNTTYQIDFYSNVIGDPSGNGEGQKWLGSTTVATDGTSNAAINATVSGVAFGRFITATATDPFGSTSEFATNIVASSTIPPTTFTVTTTNDSGPGSLRAAISNANAYASSGNDHIAFSIPGAGPHVIALNTALPSLTDPMTIDGYTQPGAQTNSLVDGNNAIILVRLDGNNNIVGAGLRCESASNVVRGLSITRFSLNGQGVELLSGGNRIEGNFIGLDPTGTNALGNSDGILLNNASNNVIGGTSPSARNVIAGNTAEGVQLVGVGASNNVIAGNFIGTDATGLLDRGNGTDGIFLSDAPLNLIGGATTASRNVISGNTSEGVTLSGNGATNNQVLNNYIGTDVTGTTALGNTSHGVLFTSQFPRNNVIGSPNPGGNIIAFNGQDGVYVQNGTNNAIRANNIFSNGGGTIGNLGIDLGNGGVLANDFPDVATGVNQQQNYPILSSATANFSSTTVQGTLPSRPSTVYQLDFFSNLAGDPSGNGEGQKYLGSTNVTTDANGTNVFNVTVSGVVLGRFITATATDPNGNTSEFSPWIRAGSTIPPLTFTVINTNNSGSGSLREAILLSNGTVSGTNNLIAFAIPGTGPHVIGLFSNLPAPTEPVTIDGYTQNGASSNTLANGNNAVLKIRLDGINAGFAADGIQLSAIGSNIVRGLSLTRFNGDGIELGGGGYNIVAGNFIGLDPDGVTVRSNSSDGIKINNSPGNTVGGTSPSARNVISGNLSDGIEFTGVTATNNAVLGNFIGTDAGGTLDLGNSAFGINLGFDTPNNIIGGSVAGARNVISGNNFSGVNVPSSRNVIQGNFIGSDVTGTLGVPNNGNGVTVAVSPGGGNLIGGTNAGAGNFIAFNNQFGVQISFGTSNAIRGNVIYSNSSVGITLGFGVTPNDPGDYDNGANDVQNFPIITNALVTAGSTTVQGTLNSRTNTTYQLDLFANVFADASGNGEGQQFLGSTSLTTGADSNGTFSVTLPVAAVGGKITATATDPQGNTSEFSPAFTAASDLPSQTFVVTNVNDSGPGSYREAINANNATVNSGNNTIAFNIIGSGPHFIIPATPFPAFTRPVLIDGFTQGGASSNTLANGNNAALRIVLVGTNASFGAKGVSFTSSSNIVRGLHIVGFASGGVELTTPGNVIEGCAIGLRPDNSAQANTHGVFINSAFNRIGGTTPAARNVISANNGSGVFFSTAGVSNNVVQGNFIGTDIPGTTARANSQFALDIFSGSTLVGGSVAGAGNAIAGSVNITLPANNTTIKGNRFGLTFGDTTITNGFGGINANSGTVLIGGTTPNERNVICNGGIQTGNSATNVTIVGNYLGTDSTGTLDRGGGGGIIINTSNTRVGGTAAGEGNIIAFGSGVFVQSGTNCPIRLNRIFANNGLGIDLGLSGVTSNDVADVDIGANNLQNFPVLTNAIANAGNVVIQGRLNSQASTVYQLDFFLNETPDPSGHGEGQYYLGSTNMTTDGAGNANFSAVVSPLRTNARHISATATDPNGNTSEFSPWIVASSTIPPTTFTVINTNDSGAGSLRQVLLDVNLLPAAGNDIIQFAIPGSGVRTIAPLTALPTPQDPVTIDGFTQTNSTPNTQTNGNNAVLLIRLDGTNMPFGGDGLDLTNHNNIIRGLEIARFGGFGIDLNGGNSNLMSGCLVWSNVNGGVFSMGGSGNRIGGSTPAARNVISANGGNGVHLQDNTNSFVAGNFIGTDVSGTAPLGNDTGVFLDGGLNNLIGPVTGGGSFFFGNPAVMRNVISGNESYGILVGNSVLGGTTVGLRILGNLIGTDVTGTFGVSNELNGITLVRAVGTTIGGTNENDPNLIAYNVGTGIQVLGNASTNNNIQANAITDNTGLGIDLGGNGVTPNDPGDADASPNHFQNFPIINSADLTETNIIVQGTLNSKPSTTYRIDIFVNVACDPSTYGEGKHYLGSVTVTTGADSNATFNVNLPVPVEGQLFTATATDPSGNTSEFGVCRQMGSLIPPVTFVVTNTADSGPGTLRQAILDNNATFNAGPNRIEFNIAGAAVKTIAPQSVLPEITRPAIIDGFTQPGASPATNGNNPVWLIRIDGTNTLGLPGNVDLIRFSNTSSNIVRGLCIVFADGDGLEIEGGGGNVIEENLIGIDVLAMTAFVTRYAIELENSRDNRVSRNVVGNCQRGINITGAGSINTWVLDNIVGLKPDGAPAPVSGTGIRPSNATGTMIKDCRIHNCGISAVGSPQAALSTTVDILSFGVTGILHDRGLNGFAAFSSAIPVPFLFSAITSNPTTVQGSLLGASNQLYTLIFYARTNATYSKVFETNVTTAANGLVNFTIVMPSLPVGTFLRATATGPAGTSEDCPDLVVMPPGPYGNSDLGITKIDSADPVPVGTNFVYTITVTNRGPVAATNLIVRDFFPSQLFIIIPPPLTTTHGQFFGGNPLSVYIPVLTNGEAATIALTCNSIIFTNVYSNYVTVVSAMPDPITANNNDFELTTVGPFTPRPTLTIAREGGQVVLRWTSNFILQTAPAVPSGPWTDMPSATSPFTVNPLLIQQFFRLRGP